MAVESACVCAQSFHWADADRALPELQRTTIVLRHYEGLSLKEIADIRDCAVGTIKSTLFQAVAKLREALGAEVMAPPGDRKVGS